MIGYSWGGFLAMAIAAAAPQRVAGYIPIEPGVPTGDSAMEAHGRWVERILSEDEQRQIEGNGRRAIGRRPGQYVVTDRAWRGARSRHSGRRSPPTSTRARRQASAWKPRTAVTRNKWPIKIVVVELD